MTFAEQYDTYRLFMEEDLKARCQHWDVSPEILSESMRYSLLAGGKRIRPVLFFAALDALGADWKGEAALAAALECIHTYSLIHDDLPALDNDDFRRGKPSNHKVYGEANAILAGDGLLSYAFELLLKEAEKGSAHLEAARILAHAAGVYGIVAGQSADLLWSDVKAGESELLFLYANKTGRMFRAPLAMAACLAKGDVPLWSRFGERLGILFQLTDDLLDRGAAGEEKRLTAVKVYGLARAEELASSCAQECCALAQRLGAPFLRDLAEEIERRKA